MNPTPKSGNQPIQLNKSKDTVSFRSRIFDFLLDLFEGVVIFAALFTIFISLFAWLLLLFIFWYTPHQNYHVSTTFESYPATGQSLQIEYPKLMLANHAPSIIYFTINGKLDKPTPLRVSIPSGLQVVDSAGKVSERVVELSFDANQSDLPQTKQIQLASSGIVDGFWYYQTQEMTIPDITGQNTPPLISNIKIETVSWAVLRDLLNSSINDKSPMILLVTGLLSGAGALLAQYLKEQRNRQKERFEKELTNQKEQQMKENNDLEIYKKDIRDGFQNRPIITIRNNIDRLINQVDPKYKASFVELLKEIDWQQILIDGIILELRDHHNSKARLILEDLNFINQELIEERTLEFEELLKQLNRLNILLLSNASVIQKQDVACILSCYKEWQEPIKPLLLSLVQKFMKYKVAPNNLIEIHNILGKNVEFGFPLLRDAKIEDQIDLYTKDAEINVDENIINAARGLKRILSSEIKWRALLPNAQRKASIKIQNWFAYHDQDYRRNPHLFPFGAEFGELERYLANYKVQHPILDHLGDANHVLVFGRIGAGKTTSALLLMQNCQNINKTLLENGSFPIYARFQPTHNPRNWLLEKISYALIDFISDNPRQFLNADAPQQIAMGRMMLRQARTVQGLQASFQRSGQVPHDDREQILKKLEKINFIRDESKLDDSEMNDFLYMARPDYFDRIYFLLDIPSSSNLEDVLTVFNTLKELALPLSKLDIYLKVFMPAEIKDQAELKSNLGNIAMFDHLELSWDDKLLRTLLDQRFEKLASFCDKRTVTNPHEKLIQAAKGSPRDLVKYGNILIKYVENELAEDKKLTLDSFLKTQESFDRQKTS